MQSLPAPSASPMRGVPQLSKGRLSKEDCVRSMWFETKTIPAVI